MEEHFEENHALIPCDICGKEIAKDKLDDHKVCLPSAAPSHPDSPAC